MALSAGTRLGPYEILEPLGAGGMGEVYRARDTRLDRVVAVKVLPSDLATTPLLRQRLDREAKAISSLSHPHICTLHDVGREGEVDFLVMELLEGETLADRLTRGSLPLDEALRHAREIAEALDAAHRHDVIHRDLKPGNVMLTESGTKLLDFGLAKLRETDAKGDDESASALRTMDQPLTGEGTIVGTYPYMAPEELEGKPADARTDLFAFGAMLYEMVTGRRAFQGESHASLISAILSSEPAPMTELQPLSPPALERVVRKCLSKSPSRRWQTARDLADELEWIEEGGAAPGTTTPTGKPALWRRALPVSLAVLVTALVTAVAFSTRRPSTPRPVTRFEIVPGAPLTDGVALSPTGAHLAYMGGPDGRHTLHVRALDRLDTQALTPTDLFASSPFFSPDGAWIGFQAFMGQTLHKVSVHGGPASALSYTGAGFCGATWGPDGTIVVATGGELRRISEAEGTEVQIASPDPSAGERALCHPAFLPGGRALLLSVLRDDSLPPQLAVLSLETGTHEVLPPTGQAPRYSPTGHIVYGTADDALWAVPFDLDRLEVTGNPVKILDGVLSFTLSDSGSLVYLPVSISEANKRTLVLVDRQGNEEALAARPLPYYIPRFSPDGTRLAIDVTDQNRDIWVYDLSAANLRRLTFDPASDNYPVWTPDGRHLIFGTTRDGPRNLYRKAADGVGQPERLTNAPQGRTPYTISPDGKTVVIVGGDSGGGIDVNVVSLDGEPTSKPLFRTPFLEMDPALSPDGRWLAYSSNESGRSEIYVRPFPDVDSGKHQVSVNSGLWPAWAPNGQELYYRQGPAMMAVTIESGPPFRFGTPKALFDWRHYNSVGRTYDVSPDGRFLMVKDDPEAASQPVRVVLNWTEVLKEKMREADSATD